MRLDLIIITGVLVYRPELSVNNFHIPHIISIGYLLFAVLVTIYLWTMMSKENKRRDSLGVTHKEGSEDALGETSGKTYILGDRAPDFRYQL